MPGFLGFFCCLGVLEGWRLSEVKFCFVTDVLQPCVGVVVLVLGTGEGNLVLRFLPGTDSTEDLSHQFAVIKNKVRDPAQSW